VRIAHVPLGYVEGTHLLPGERVRAAQDEDARRGEEHVAVRAVSEREVELPPEADQVREGVVVAIVVDPVQSPYLDVMWHCFPRSPLVFRIAGP